MIDKMIPKTLGTLEAIRIAHWAAKGEGSYARHVALGDLYDALDDKLDEIVEVYQGYRPLVSVTYRVALPETDIVSHLQGEAEWIATNRDQIADGIPSLANLIDEMHGVLGRGLYKLKHLK